MLKVKNHYKLKEDIEFILETSHIDIFELSIRANISRPTLAKILRDGEISQPAIENFYSYAYLNKYRLNSTKEELLKEQYPLVLFHGSKSGLSNISISNGRIDCDFGRGFYLGDNYNQALTFVFDNDKSSVFSFIANLDNLKIKRFNCSLEWMLAICYYRGAIDQYKNNEIIKKIILETEEADVIVALIADNKMFYVMSQFAQGDINADVAIHSLSSFKLGNQYVFKTEKSLSKLIPFEQYYLSIPERKDAKRTINERALEIDTKLRLAKRQFKTGLYIEEIFK